MAETLFNQFADESALQAQRDFFINEILKPIKEGILALNVKVGNIDTTQSKKNVDELSKSTDTLGKNIADAQQRIVDLNNTLKGYNQTVTSTAKSQKDYATATADSAKADQAAAAAKKSKAASANDVEKAQKAEQKAAEDAANDYLQLAKAYNDAALKAKNYQLRLGENHPLAVQATKDANDMANTLKRLDASVGQNQRNVGNYASAVSGLGFSFTQVARELPSLAVNFQQFALAISNNLPYVADSLAKTKKELEALRAEGKQAPSLFSAIAKSILTWQVALAVGITIFTIYAKQIGEFVSGLFKAGEAINQAKDAQNILNEVYKESNSEYEQAISHVTELKTEIDLAKQGFIDKGVVLKRYNETIGQTTGEVKTLDEAEQALNQNAEAYIKFTLLKAAANIALAKAARESVKQAEDQQNFNEDLVKATKDSKKKATVLGATDAGEAAEEGKEAEKRVAAEKKKAKEISDKRINNFNDIAKEFLTQMALLSSQFKFNFFGSSGDSDKAVKEIDKLLTGALETISRRQHEIADNEDNFVAERLKARQKAFNADKQLLQLRTAFEILEARKSAADQIEQQKGNAENIKVIQSNLAKEIAYIKDQAGRDRRALEDKDAEDVLKINNEFYKRLIDNVLKNEKALAEAKKGNIAARNDEAKQQFEEDQLLTSEFYDQQEHLIESSLKKQKITFDEYQRAKELNQLAFRKGQIDDEIAYQQKLLATARLENNDTSVAAIERKIFELKKRLREEDIKDLEKYLSKVVDFEKKATEDIKKAIEKLTDDLRTTAFAIIEGSYDRQINKIRDQIDVVNELKAAEIERVNSSTDTAERKAARIITIEARAQSQREALERRQRENEKKKAVVQKAAAAFEITVGGIKDVGRIKSEFVVAIAAAQKLPPPLNAIYSAKLIAQEAALIGLTIATTAASLASVVGTPIPSFAKGTDNSPEGIAEVAERGPELAIDKQGKAKLYEKHTLTYLSKGTKIYPADATKDILNAAESERRGLIKSFNKNITISAPDHSAELKEQTKLLKSIDSKPVKFIIHNEPGIETTPFFMQHFKS